MVLKTISPGYGVPASLMLFCFSDLQKLPVECLEKIISYIPESLLYLVNTFSRNLSYARRKNYVVESKHLFFDTLSMLDKMTSFTVLQLQGKDIPFVDLMKTLIDQGKLNSLKSFKLVGVDILPQLNSLMHILSKPEILSFECKAGDHFIVSQLSRITGKIPKLKFLSVEPVNLIDDSDVV